MKYDNDACNKFVRDMKAIGFKTEHYRGRNFWEGPAVRAPTQKIAEAIIIATKISLQTDSMGRGTIYYPKASGRLVEEIETQEDKQALEILEVTTSVLIGLRDDLRDVGGFDQKVFDAFYLLEEAITARVAELEGAVNLGRLLGGKL